MDLLERVLEGVWVLVDSLVLVLEVELIHSYANDE